MNFFNPRVYAELSANFDKTVLLYFWRHLEFLHKNRNGVRALELE